jgi:Helix-turn-helix domain
MLQDSLQLLTVRETAQVLRQSEWSVRQKIGRGEIPALRVGVGPRPPFRILPGDLEQWLLRLWSPKPPVSAVASGGTAWTLSGDSRTVGLGLVPFCPLLTSERARW